MSVRVLTKHPGHPMFCRLSWRARWLLRLERWFPVVAVPQHRGEHARYEYEKAAGSYAALIEEVGGLAGKRVLDFGCGWGGETAWLSERAAHAVGVDIDRKSLRDAEQFKARLGRTNLSFIHIADAGLPFADDTFDVVLSTNVFEHVMQPAAALREIHRVLRPGGAFLTKFGPLFYSPLGYHLPWATQVPFAHLLFGLKPMIEVRNLKRSAIQPKCWEQIGLNRLTFSQFRQAVTASGLQPKRLRRVPVKNLHLLASLPGVGNLLTFGVDCYLIKAM